MSKIIKNLSSENKTYAGMMIAAGESYTIAQDELKAFQISQKLMEDFLKEAPEASIASEVTPSQEMIGADAIKFLLSNVVTVEELPQNYPFAKKELADGKKLFRRKHGIRKECPGETETFIDMVVPYVQCKIDEVEIINCSGNDDVDLKVLDTAENAYSQAPVESVGPNYLLNQFGFDVCVSDLYYSDSSNYDADLFQGMIVRAVFKNRDTESKNIGINFVLHEVK